MDSNEGDKGRGFGAFSSSFLVANQAAVAHELGYGALHNPGASQAFEPACGIRALDHLNLQVGTQPFDAMGKLL